MGRPYHLGRSTRFPSTRSIGQDQWEIIYEGNKGFDRRTVEYSALFRAAEVALANGCPWFEVMSRGEGERVYSRRADSLRIGQVSLAGIVYNFFSGQLRGVEISVAAKDLPALEETLAGVWGAPETKSTEVGFISKWYSENNGSDNTVALLFRHGEWPATLQICNGKFYEVRMSRAVAGRAKDDL